MHTQVFNRSTSPCAVLVVEDDVRMRRAFEHSIRADSRLYWLDGLGTVREASRWLTLSSRAPDVLLVDLGLPDGSGLEVIRCALARFPRCDPLVISIHDDAASLLASIEAGAVGYLHKDASPEDIVQTLLDVNAGASPISPMIARRLLIKYRSLHLAASAVATACDGVAADNAAASMTVAPMILSAREREVLELIARGFSYAEIARLKTLSVNTVQTHIKNLYGKLAVHSKNEAVFEAMRLGLLRHP